MGLYSNDFSEVFSKLLAKADVSCYRISQYTNLDEGYLSRLIGVNEAWKFVFYLQNNAIRWEDNPLIEDDKHLSPFSVQAYVRAIL